MREICFDSYFWQNELVRLALWKKEIGRIIITTVLTLQRSVLNYEVELPPTVTEAQELMARFAEFKPGTGRLMFTITTLDGQSVGGINLNSIDEKNGTFSVGMQIDRDHRGKGYGTAAMEIVLRYAFYERRLNKYYGSVLESNIASATMLKKLGCVEEGRRRQMVYSQGRYYDEILFGLTREEFERNYPPGL